MTTSTSPAAQAGSYPVGDLDLNRIGYGAMQLAGPGVLGPPPDRVAAIEVLRTAVELGDDQGGWIPGNSPQSLREQVHGNLDRLGLDTLDLVYLRTTIGIVDRPVAPGTLTPQFEALAALQQQGLIRHLGLSTVSLDELAEAQRIAPVVSVENFYNIANRADDAVLAATAAHGIAYVPYFPLGGFAPLQSDVLRSVAEQLDATPTAVAQAWLLQHSPNILLIPGTSSPDHLRQNIAGAALALPPDAVTKLDAI
jgi:pyridoxine 4-dehydrogenase